ncbi:MAG: type II and III secretion system protein family protein [bacterium]
MKKPDECGRYSKNIYFILLIVYAITFFKFIKNSYCIDNDTIVPQTLQITIGKSVILERPAGINRVSLANPEVADANVLSHNQIILIGKAAGVTNVTLWRTSAQVSDIFDLEVIPDITCLKKKLNTIFPQENDIHITATYDSVTLNGTVSSMVILNRVVSLVKTYAPKGNNGEPMLNNFLEIGGVHQVMLEVSISEISRNLMKQLGINFNSINSTGTQYGVSLLDNLSTVDALQNIGYERQFQLSDDIVQQAGAQAFPVTALGVSSSVNAIFRFFDGSTPWTVLIAALKDRGLLKILAEPTLITLSGKHASFLAGGEYPIPVLQNTSTGVEISIDYKPFGVALSFTPTVLSKEKISIEVEPEISEIDLTKGVPLGGYVVPAITTRRVSTIIELADGQSFAVAGLLKDDIRQIVRKYPLLGDIPILGALFRSKSFQNNKTELMIMVTPHLVKPLDKTKTRLPTDEYIEPDDFEFFLLGGFESEYEPLGEQVELFLNSTELPSFLKTDKGLDGNFGYINPL